MSLRLVIAVLAAVLAGCAQAPSPPSLAGREFVSTRVLENGVQRALVAGTQVRLTFTDDGIGANAGCNHIGGSARIQDGRLAVGQLSVTAMGCDADRHAQDDWLSRFLGSLPTVALEGPNLVLESGGTRIELVDRQVAEPPQPLVGPRWVVDSLVSGDSVSSVPPGVAASLELHADGTVAVNTGCNQGSGRWTADDETIRFSDVALTRRGCPGPEGDVEAHLNAVLASETLVYSITHDTLLLDAGGRGVSLRAQQPAS